MRSEDRSQWRSRSIDITCTYTEEIDVYHSGGGVEHRLKSTKLYGTWKDMRELCCRNLDVAWYTCKWNKYISWPSSSTDACMVWRHPTFLTTSSSSIPIVVVILATCYLSDVHGDLLSAIVHFRWLEAAFGTVCHLTLPQLLRWLFFETASKLHNC